MSLPGFSADASVYNPTSYCGFNRGSKDEFCDLIKPQVEPVGTYDCYGVCMYICEATGGLEVGCSLGCAALCEIEDPTKWVEEPFRTPSWIEPWPWYSVFAAALAIDAAAVAVGGLGGWALDRSYEKKIPIPFVTAGCVTNPVAPRVRTMNYSAVGSARAQANAVQQANDICAAVPGQCTGSCPAPIGCHATAEIVYGTYQSEPCWGGFATCVSFAYTCECGC